MNNDCLGVGLLFPSLFYTRLSLLVLQNNENGNMTSEPRYPSVCVRTRTMNVTGCIASFRKGGKEINLIIETARWLSPSISLTFKFHLRRFERAPTKSPGCASVEICFFNSFHQHPCSLICCYFDVAMEHNLAPRVHNPRLCEENAEYCDSPPSFNAPVCINKYIEQRWLHVLRSNVC